MKKSRKSKGVIISYEEEHFEKIFAGTLACICMMEIAVPQTLITKAENVGTVKFNITVGKKTSPDPLSKRSAKRDNEQNAYVTATAFDDIGTISCVSIRKSGGIQSSAVTVKSSEINKKKKMVYQGTAKKDEVYYKNTAVMTAPNCC